MRNPVDRFDSPAKPPAVDAVNVPVPRSDVLGWGLVVVVIALAAGLMTFGLLKIPAPTVTLEQTLTRRLDEHMRVCRECNRETEDGGPAPLCPEAFELLQQTLQASKK